MSDERLANVVKLILFLLAVLIALAFLTGLGFEAVKWLGHTQK